jgi:hypothetical protein
MTWLVVVLVWASVGAQPSGVAGRWQRITAAEVTDVPAGPTADATLEITEEATTVHVRAGERRRTFTINGTLATGLAERVDGGVVLRWTESVRLPSGTATVTHTVRLLPQPDGTLEKVTEVQERDTTVRRSVRYRRSDG